MSTFFEDKKEKEAPRVSINFNRKILTRKNLQAIKDTLDSQGSLRGEAVDGVVDDLIKLRYLCEQITELSKAGQIDRAIEGLRMLELVL